jgi:hypothetical protein
MLATAVNGTGRMRNIFLSATYSFRYMGVRMSLLLAFIICFVILGIFSKALTTPPDVYAHLETKKQDHHGHH